MQYRWCVKTDMREYLTKAVLLKFGATQKKKDVNLVTFALFKVFWYPCQRSLQVALCESSLDSEVENLNLNLLAASIALYKNKPLLKTSVNK